MTTLTYPKTENDTKNALDPPPYRLKKMMATKLHNLSHSSSRLDGIIREISRNGLKHLLIKKTSIRRDMVRNCIIGM